MLLCVCRFRSGSLYNSKQDEGIMTEEDDSWHSPPICGGGICGGGAIAIAEL